MATPILQMFVWRRPDQDSTHLQKLFGGIGVGIPLLFKGMFTLEMEIQLPLSTATGRFVAFFPRKESDGRHSNNGITQSAISSNDTVDVCFATFVSFFVARINPEKVQRNVS